METLLLLNTNILQHKHNRTHLWEPDAQPKQVTRRIRKHRRRGKKEVLNLMFFVCCCLPIRYSWTV